MSEPARIITLVYEQADVRFSLLADRYVIGLVCELPNGKWENRWLHRNDWIPLGAGREVTDQELAQLEPYLQVEGKTTT